MNSNKLDQELIRLPDPPKDLPRSWNWRRWRQFYTAGFFVCLFSLWAIGRWANILILDQLSDSFAWTASLFLVIGLILVYHFQLRGYRENYSKKANKPLYQAIRRYRRRDQNERYLQIFPRYQIDQNNYYLIWYVPGFGNAFVASLTAGSEPLIFNDQGQWLDNESLFNKIALMWSYALDFSPRSVRWNQIQDIKKRQRKITRTLNELPALLSINQHPIQESGFGQAYEKIREAYPAIKSLYRHDFDSRLKLARWAEAYGYDSITHMDYETILDLHLQNERVQQSIHDFKLSHRTDLAAVAAERLVHSIGQNPPSTGSWKRQKELIEGLSILSERFQRPKGRFRLIDGEWVAPEKFLVAYRARVAYARQVDQQRP